MKNVWFFGDSSTFGHGLRKGSEYHDLFIENKKPLWTELASDYFNGNELNFGLCGASNDDITFRVITNLFNIKKDDIVFIQYGHPTRFNIFDSNNDYKSVHVAFKNSIGIGEKNEQILKNYFESFIVPKIEKYEIRDFIYFLSLKKEIESKGAFCVLWSHELISETFRIHHGWESIYDESNKKYDDKYHMGFSSQIKFFNFLKEQIKKGNTIIKPKNLSDGNFEMDIIDMSLLDKIYLEQLDSIHKHYDEGHIFI